MEKSVSRLSQSELPVEKSVSRSSQSSSTKSSIEVFLGNADVYSNSENFSKFSNFYLASKGLTIWV